jgi:hypothetical protein
VGEADPEVRQTLEDPAEDELRDGQRRLERVADDQREIVLREPLLPDERRRRVDEHRDVEVAPARARADLDRAAIDATFSFWSRQNAWQAFGSAQ